MESILTPIKLYLKDDNFKEIEELRISFSCKLQDYKFYKELFTPGDKMGVFYFEDYKVICNNTIIIKSPGFNKSINNINVDGNEELLSKVGVNNYFNLIMEYKSIKDLNLNEKEFKSIDLIILKLIILCNMYESENCYFKVIENKDYLNLNVDNKIILDILNFIKDKGSFLKYNSINSEFFSSLGYIISNLISKYDISEEHQLILKNSLVKDNYKSSNISIKELIDRILSILNLKNVVEKCIIDTNNQLSKCNSVNEESKELYHSIITQTNWHEELEYGNFMGLLLRVIPHDINKYSYSYDYIPISSITNTIISFEQYLEAYDNSFNQNQYYVKDLWCDVLSGNGVGEGNCILPLYINKSHWEMAKLYFNYNLGIIFNRNCLDYSDSQKNIYKNVLIKMINMTYCNSNYSSDKWLNLLFSVFRTYYEIFKVDNINNLSTLNKFKNDMYFRVDCNINEVLLKYILYEIEDENLLNIIFEEIIRRSFKHIYKDIYKLDEIYKFTENLALNLNVCNMYNLVDDLAFSEWIIELENNKIFSDNITLIHGICMIKKVINKLDIFDNNNGVLDVETLNILKSHVKSHILNPENYKLIGLMNPNFESHVNFTKEKIYTLSSLRKIGIVTNIFQLRSLLVQCLMQRVNKSRKNAIKNNKVQNPFIPNNIIESTGELLAQRYLKKIYNLSHGECKKSYITFLNNLDESKFDSVYKILIEKTISIKKYLIDNIDKIDVKYRYKLINS